MPVSSDAQEIRGRAALGLIDDGRRAARARLNAVAVGVDAENHIGTLQVACIATLHAFRRFLGSTDWVFPSCMRLSRDRRQQVRIPKMKFVSKSDGEAFGPRKGGRVPRPLSGGVFSDNGDRTLRKVSVNPGSVLGARV